MNTGGGSFVVGDGRYLPFKDGAFEIVFSNSVIEHVGQFEDQQLLAAEIRRVGRQYFVQTPDRNFFFEPHLLTSFVHWLPPATQKRLLRNFTLWGLINKPSERECQQFMDTTRLLSVDEMAKLFPDAEIRHELFLGMSKCLIAIKIAEKPSTPDGRS